MKRIKLVSMLGLSLGLGFAGLGCDTGGVDPNAGLEGMPALTAEEQAVVDNMNKNTLAEIELPEGKMKFVEYSPGEVMIMRQFPVGAQLTRVEGEDKMNLDEIFRAYAPGREVPKAIYGALDRVTAYQRAHATMSGEPAGRAELYQGTRLEAHGQSSPDGIQRTSSALASTINQAWFTSTFCRVSGADWTWCFATAWQGAYASRKTHRSNSETCGDTGAARVNFHQNGTLRVAFDVPYGQCWHSGGYHGAHGFLGVNLETTQKYSIPYAQSTVRFAGWNADEDQFLSGW
jgi:hypothetical protein